MTVEEALHTIEKTLEPWAAKNGMQKVWSRAILKDTNACVEYSGGQVLLQFTWDRHDPIVFTTIYRTSEAGPDDEQERSKWRYGLPRVSLEQLRKGVEKLKTFVEGRVNTPDELIARLNAQTAELEPMIQRMLNGDWSNVPLRDLPSFHKKTES